MQLQLNTDGNIEGDSSLTEFAEDIVTSALGHLVSRITRVEVYLADANAAKGGSDDILCTVAARPEGLQPMVTTHSDANVKVALRGAAKKLRAAMDSQFGKLSKH